MRTSLVGIIARNLVRIVSGLLFTAGLAVGGYSVMTGFGLLEAAGATRGGETNPVIAVAGLLSGVFGVVALVVCGVGLAALIGSAMVKVTWARALLNAVWVGLLLLCTLPPFLIGQQILSVRTERAETLSKAKNDGDPYSQLKVGDRYYHQWQYSQVDDTNTACLKALRWYLEAAYQAEARGQKKVASTYYHCVSGDRRIKEALAYIWYRVVGEHPIQIWEYTSALDVYLGYARMKDEDIEEAEAFAVQVITVFADQVLSPEQRRLAIERILAPLVAGLSSTVH